MGVFVLLKKITSIGQVNTLYSIQSPSVNNLRCNAVFAFSNDGGFYYVDGHNWGYHIIESNKDNLEEIKLENEGEFLNKVEDKLSSEDYWSSTDKFTFNFWKDNKPKRSN